MILSVCIASATFCARLKRQALAHSEPSGQIVPLQPIQQSISEETGGRYPFDQGENLRNAILMKKARIAEIERALNRPPTTEYRGRPVHGGDGWRQRLEEERQHLLLAVRDLEAEADRPDLDANREQPFLPQKSEKTVQARESKSSGRPRKDGEREMVRELKEKGESWKGIAEKVNTQTGQNKSPDAYRSLLKARSDTSK